VREANSLHEAGPAIKYWEDKRRRKNSEEHSRREVTRGNNENAHAFGVPLFSRSSRAVPAMTNDKPKMENGNAS
jgi:hypothetical protein